MAYLEELLPHYRNGAKIRRKSWDAKVYVHLIGKECCDEKGYIFDLNTSLIADDWEFYQDPIDWDCIINNKCFCWFWDSKLPGIVGILESIKEDDNSSFKYIDSNCTAWMNCRPVLKAEIIFYEDKSE